MLMHFLEQSFLPDLRAATMMDSPRALESDTALALNRYLCNAVLPLLTNHSHFFAEAEHHAALLDATLHTVSPILTRLYYLLISGLPNESSPIPDKEPTRRSFRLSCCFDSRDSACHDDQTPTQSYH
jgi:hypothetical protein